MRSTFTRTRNSRSLRFLDDASIKLLWRMFRPVRGQLLVNIVVMLVYAAVDEGSTLLIRDIVNELRLTPTDIHITYLYISVGTFMVLQLLAGFLSIVYATWLANLGERTSAALREMLYQQHQKLLLQEHRAGAAAQLEDMIGRLVNTPLMFTNVLTTLAASVIDIAIGWLLLMILGWQFLVLEVVLLVPVLLVISRTRKKLRKSRDEANDRKIPLKSLAASTISVNAVYQLNAISGFSWALKHFKRLDAAFTEKSKSQDRWNRLRSAVYVFVSMVGLALVYALGGQLLAWKIPVMLGSILAAVAVHKNVVSALNSISGVADQTQSAERMLKDATAFLERPTYKDREGSVRLDKITTLELQAVSAGYPGKDVLGGVSLKLYPGKVLAVVGRNGAGKSTLAYLLARDVEPSKGRVLVNGRNYLHVTRDSLRQRMISVSQEAYLFGRFTIWENLLVGNPDSSDDIQELQERMESLCKAVNIHADIMKLPNGYNTVVAEGGSNLSSGQRQRLAIVRALLRRPDILILDEANSNLDSEGGAALQEELARQQENGLCIVLITHRMSMLSTMAVDEILVLEEGKIVQRGSHRRLRWQLWGPYRKLYKAQYRRATTARRSFT